METLSAKNFRFADFELDVGRRLLLKDGSPVALHSRAFELLLTLVESRGELLTKDELLDRVWPGQFVEEGNLKVHIHALRKCLGESRAEHRFIVTVPGRGYSFVAELKNDGQGELVVETQRSSTITIDKSFGESVISGFRVNPRGAAVAAIGAVAVVTIGVIAAYLLLPSRTSVSAADFQIKQLTTSGKVATAALSPDGKLFAFALGTTGYPVSLWLGHTSGGEQVELRPASDVWYHDLHFSPDGSHLYFVASQGSAGNGALFRIPVLGGVPEKLRDGVRTEISFSPDMERFAYVRNDAGVSKLLLADVRGTDEREIAARPIKTRFVPSTVAWSRDGRVVAIAAARDENGDSDSELLAVNVEDGQSRQITTRLFTAVLAASWTADGNALLISATEHPRWDSQLWSVSYSTGAVEPFTSDLHIYSETLYVSSDGGSVLAIQKNTLANLWIAPTEDLAAARQITRSSINGRAGTHGLEWLPNGQILFPAFSDRSQALWLVNPDGSGQKRLTPEGSIDQQPGVSADGSTIVFTSNRSGAAEIWRMNGDGGDLRQITSGGHNDMPTISPDGRWVVYISRRESLATIWRIAAEGGEPVRLAERYAAWPRISPDSRFVACAYASGEKLQLAIIPIEGGPPSTLLDVPRTANFRFGLRWTPDGRALVYRDWTKGYWRQDVAGGEPEKLKGLPDEKLFSFGWSPDSTLFAFSRGTETRDVMFFTNPSY